MAANDSAKSPDAILDHHLKAFTAQDLDAILKDYADDAMIVAPGHTAKGMAKIRELFRGLFAEFSGHGGSIKLQHRTVDGKIAFIVWHAETGKNAYPFATDTFVIENGKIVCQTFAAHIVAK